MLYAHAMKHIGADNFLLYVLCAAATRVEAAAKATVRAARRLLQSTANLLPEKKSASPSSDRRLVKPRFAKDS